MSRLEQIQTFVKVIDENSFAAASRKMGLSTAAVSKQISTLEKGIGLQLISRSTRKLALTEPGKAYYEYAKKMLNDLEEMEDLVLQMRSEPIGKLRVTSQRFFGEQFIVPYLSEFLQTHPKVSLELELAERVPDIEKEQIDILIGMSIPSSLNSIQKKIAETHYVMCAAPSYLAKFGTPRFPKDMVQHRYINHFVRVPQNLIHFKHSEEIYVIPYLLLNDTRAMLECAIQGLGIVKLHYYVVRDALEKGLVNEVLKEYAEPTQPILVSYLPQKFSVPKIRHFIDFISSKINFNYFD